MKKTNLVAWVALPLLAALLLGGCRATVHKHPPHRGAVVVKPAPKTVVVHHHHHRP